MSKQQFISFTWYGSTMDTIAVPVIHNERYIVGAAYNTTFEPPTQHVRLEVTVIDDESKESR